MTRSLALRALAGAGAFAASMALGTGWASAAPAAGAGSVSSRTFSTPAQTPGDQWCAFLAWLYGWDVCGRNNGGGGGPGPGPGNGPGWARPRPSRAGTDHPDHRPAGDGQPRRTGRGLWPRCRRPRHHRPPGPDDRAAGHPAAGPAADRGARGGRRAGAATAARTTPTNPTTAAPPPTAATTAATVPSTMAARIGGLVEPEVLVQPVVEVPRDIVPEPRRTDRSLIRSVIDTTSGPIGRRVVALAGVLLAVAIGILAATIDDRTQLVRRIQEHRHVDEH